MTFIIYPSYVGSEVPAETVGVHSTIKRDLRRTTYETWMTRWLLNCSLLRINSGRLKDRKRGGRREREGRGRGDIIKFYHQFGTAEDEGIQVPRERTELWQLDSGEFPFYLFCFVIICLCFVLFCFVLFCFVLFCLLLLIDKKYSPLYKCTDYRRQQRHKIYASIVQCTYPGTDLIFISFWTFYIISFLFCFVLFYLYIVFSFVTFLLTFFNIFLFLFHCRWFNKLSSEHRDYAALTKEEINHSEETRVGWPV